MKLLTISSYEDFPKQYLNDFLYLQRDCWGREPFGEFHICPDCKRLYSIEEVCWVENISSYSSVIHICNECKCETELMYWEDFLEVIKDYFQYNVGVILAFSDSWELVWFWVIVKKAIQDILEYEFSTRPKSYPQDLSLALSQKAFGDILHIHTEVLLLHHIYVIPQFRSSGLVFLIIQKLLDFFYWYDWPILLETHLLSKFYPITRYLWFENVWNPDRYWYVAQVSDSLGDIKKSLESIIIWKYISSSLHIFREEASYTLSWLWNTVSQRYYLTESLWM